MGIQSRLATYLNEWNEWNEYGNFSLLSYEDALGSVPPEELALQPDDIAIYYDYCDDELSEGDKDRLSGWLYDDAWPLIHKYMEVNKYVEVFENDGSGSGLYYGMVVFRKK